MARGARGHDRELAVLRELWGRQRSHAEALGASGMAVDYLHAHFEMDLTLRRHLLVLDRIAPYLGGRVLEWGCRHGLDACVYRMRMGDRVELHGCDLDDAPGLYRPFFEFSGLRYQRLVDAVRLGYDDDTFDAVTSNGVLEHVEDDAASAREIWRVLRPGGVFVVACLPNRSSYTEAIQRRLGHSAHDRLYSLRSARRLLERAGFVVEAAGVQFLVPTMLNGFPARVRAAYGRAEPLVWAVNGALERLWPVNRLASNLFLAARKPGGPPAAQRSVA